MNKESNKRYYCHGKKDFCHKGNDNTVVCDGCEFFNDEGGETLLISQDKSNNFDVKSNNELFKQAINEGLSNKFDKTIEQAKQIEEMAKAICEVCKCDGDCSATICSSAFVEAEYLYNEGWRKPPDNIGEFSDGYHTFNELYHHRAVLFSVICNMFPEKAWKSKLHDTGDMFDNMFIVGIETEQGQATYHYDIEPYWDMFKVKELEKAPKWDGHTPSDAIQRIGNIKQIEGEWKDRYNGKYANSIYECSLCKEKALWKVETNELGSPKITQSLSPFCPNCGAKMKGGEE